MLSFCFSHFWSCWNPMGEAGTSAAGGCGGWSCRLPFWGPFSTELRLPACLAPLISRHAPRPPAECGPQLPAGTAAEAGRRRGGLRPLHAGSGGPPPPQGDTSPLARRFPLRAAAPPALCPRGSSPAPPAPPFLLQLKMAAEVDFGDRELFEQLEEEDGPPPPPRLGFDGEEEEEGPEKALEELYARLQDREETVRRLRAENILTGEAGPAPAKARGEEWAPLLLLVPFRASLDGSGLSRRPGPSVRPGPVASRRSRGPGAACRALRAELGWRGRLSRRLLSSGAASAQLGAVALFFLASVTSEEVFPDSFLS